MGETLLIVLVAHVIAMILVELFLHGFNNLTGKLLFVDYKNFGLYLSLFTCCIDMHFIGRELSCILFVFSKSL